MDKLKGLLTIPNVLIALAVIVALVMVFGTETVIGWVEAVYGDATEGGE